MVSLGAAVGVAVIVLVNTAVAAVFARYFRLALATRVGALLFTAAGVPVLYVVTTIVLGGALGLGNQVFAGDDGLFFTLCWGFPFFLGLSIHLFWLPPVPE